MSYPVIIRYQGRIWQLKPYHINIFSKEGEVGLNAAWGRMGAKMVKFTISTKLGFPAFPSSFF